MIEHNIGFSGNYGLKLNEDSGSGNSSDGVGVDSLGLISLAYSGIIRFPKNEKKITLSATIDENNINSYSSFLELDENTNLTIKTVPNISVGTIGLPNMFKSLFTTNGAGVTSDSETNLTSIMYNRVYPTGLVVKSGINNIKTMASADATNTNNNNQLINTLKNTTNYIGGQIELQYNSERLGSGVIGVKLGRESTNLVSYGDSDSDGIYMSYNYGPLSLGFESTDFDLDRANDIDQRAFSIGFAINDGLSLSYQSMKIDNNTGGQPDEDLTGFGIVYKLRNMVVNANYSQIENDNFTANNDSSHMDLAIVFDF